MYVCVNRVICICFFLKDYNYNKMLSKELFNKRWRYLSNNNIDRWAWLREGGAVKVTGPETILMEHLLWQEISWCCHQGYYWLGFIKSKTIVIRFFVFFFSTNTFWNLLSKLHINVCVHVVLIVERIFYTKNSLVGS